MLPYRDKTHIFFYRKMSENPIPHTEDTYPGLQDRLDLVLLDLMDLVLLDLLDLVLLDLLVL